MRGSFQPFADFFTSQNSTSKFFHQKHFMIKRPAKSICAKSICAKSICLVYFRVQLLNFNVILTDYLKMYGGRKASLILSCLNTSSETIRLDTLDTFVNVVSIVSY